ncbi:hypothetical protein ALC57_09007 [Trachymyrmex cornetzi]|uniref:Uncharacterized protein n=1 Tax=Trachymyrmex cornetzi TaxID=471704 RepID=A0A151J624_9HYME|nr:hypothetical protein ALC57_09007 [Trachymyrmex cornetzi]
MKSLSQRSRGRTVLRRFSGKGTDAMRLGVSGQESYVKRQNGIIAINCRLLQILLQIIYVKKSQPTQHVKYQLNQLIPAVPAADRVRYVGTIYREMPDTNYICENIFQFSTFSGYRNNGCI